VVLGPRISTAKTVDVGCVKRLNLQRLAPGTAGVPNILHLNRGIPERADGQSFRGNSTSERGQPRGRRAKRPKIHCRT
jgi:hypothetical protein